MAYAGKSGETRRLRALPKTGPRATLTPAATPRPVGAVATGIAIGLLVGAGVALLLAPQRGAETRYDIRHGFSRARRRGRDAWEDLRDELSLARRRLLRVRRRRQVQLDEPVEP